MMVRIGKVIQQCKVQKQSYPILKSVYSAQTTSTAEIAYIYHSFVILQLLYLKAHSQGGL